MNEKKGIGLNPISQIHYTDHLAVICIIMGIPLLFLDEGDYAIGKKYYPGLSAIREEFNNFNPEYVISNWDVIFMSDLWGRDTIKRKFQDLESKYHKTLRSVHCPHGFSDKGFYLAKCVEEDIVLVYGQNMIDMLKEYGVYENLRTYVLTGNYRYTYYQQNRSFYNAIVEREILSRFKDPGKLILYAPTWLDLEESTTFFDVYDSLLSNIPESVNLLVKLHPRLELDDTVLYYQIVGKYENRPNIVFLKDYPLVYPLLEYADAYIGDMSSVGYDYLIFNRPMFFLNKQKIDPMRDRRGFLFQCGISILPENYRKIYQIMEKEEKGDAEKFGQIRKEMWEYTFGPERSFEAIKADIIAAYA
jgi:hypothetical protein